MRDDPGTSESDDGSAKWRRRAVVAWAIIGIIGVFLLAVRGLMLVGPAVELLLVGGIVGYICSPITNRLEDRGMSRALAAFIALFVVILVLTVTLVVFGSPFVEQTITVLRNVPTYVAQFRGYLTSFWASYGSTDNADLQTSVNSVVSSLSSVGTDLASTTARQLSTNIVENLLGTVSDLINFFLGLVLAYWLAKDYPIIVRELCTIAGPRHSDQMTLMFAVMSRSMGGYMRGQLITSIANAVMAFVGCALIGHPYAGLVGTTTFIMHFIPVIGPFFSALLATVLALAVNPSMALWALVIMIVSTNVADNLLSPLVMQSAVKVHPALTLVGIVFGSSLGGIPGMVLAIPLTAAVRGVFVYFFEEHTARQLVSYDGAFFRSTPFHDANGNIQPTYDALDDDKFFESTRLVSGEHATRVKRDARPAGMRSTMAERMGARAEAFAKHRASERAHAQELRNNAGPGASPTQPDDGALDSQRNKPSR